MIMLVLFCVYIAIIPIVLSFCKAAGIDERFKEGEEYLENFCKDKEYFDM